MWLVNDKVFYDEEAACDEALRTGATLKWLCDECEQEECICDSELDWTGVVY